MSFTVCSYKGCNNSTMRIKGLVMHRFPPLLSNEWIKNSGNTDLIGLSPIFLNKSKKICHLHFKEEDILPSGRLVKTAVLICYVPPGESGSHCVVPPTQGEPREESIGSSEESLRVTHNNTTPKKYGKQSTTSKTATSSIAMMIYPPPIVSTDCVPFWMGVNQLKPSKSSSRLEVPNLCQSMDSKKTATISTAVTHTNAASSNFEISNNETIKTIIKEEIDADEDDSYSPTVSRDSDQMEFEGSFIDDQEPSEDPLADNQYGNNSSDIKFNIHQRRPATNVATAKAANTSRKKADKSTNTEKFQGLSNILGIADSLALDIENILTDDICNFFDVNPMRSRRQIPRPTSDKEPTLSDLKSKCAELELKLRIHYLKDMIKHEQEISNLQKEVNRLQIVKEKMEIENNRDAHLQRMENLKLEHALLNLHLLNRAK